MVDDPNVIVKRSRLRRWLKRIIIAAIVFWVLNVLFMKLIESRLVFQPTTAAESWRNPQNQNVEDITFISADGNSIHAWWMPSSSARGAALVLHGNGGNLSYRGGFCTNLQAALNRSVLIIDYPGYGKSSGEPSEASCYAAAPTALDWLQSQNIPSQKVVVLGESLGGGIATDVASRRECAALVLVKTFTSVPDVAADLFPWLPARWLMTNRFDSISKIGKVKRPAFVAHGTVDRTVPLQFGERLYVAANEPKRFLKMEGIGHNNPMPPEFYTELRRFLDKNVK